MMISQPVTGLQKLRRDALRPAANLSFLRSEKQLLRPGPLVAMYFGLKMIKDNLFMPVFNNSHVKYIAFLLLTACLAFPETYLEKKYFSFLCSCYDPYENRITELLGDTLLSQNDSIVPIILNSYIEADNKGKNYFDFILGNKCNKSDRLKLSKNGKLKLSQRSYGFHYYNQKMIASFEEDAVPYIINYLSQDKTSNDYLFLKILSDHAAKKHKDKILNKLVNKYIHSGIEFGYVVSALKHAGDSTAAIPLIENKIKDTSISVHNRIDYIRLLNCYGSVPVIIDFFCEYCKDEDKWDTTAIPTKLWKITGNDLGFHDDTICYSKGRADRTHVKSVNKDKCLKVAEKWKNMINTKQGMKNCINGEKNKKN